MQRNVSADIAAIMSVFPPLAGALSATIRTNSKTLEALLSMPEAIDSGNDKELRRAVNDALDQLAGANIMIQDSMTAIEQAAKQIGESMEESLKAAEIDDINAGD